MLPKWHKYEKETEHQFIANFSEHRLHVTYVSQFAKEKEDTNRRQTRKD